ncbi:MAG: hypothetical protein LUG98_00355 [Tannerellaceae bacterium]|nr:hypothetical protein [Tannerellaceae bacterium]
MPAYYKFVRKPAPGVDPNQQPLSVRFVPNEVLEKEEMYEQAARMGGYSTAQVVGMVKLLQNLLVFNLSRGSQVSLEGVGTFSLSVSCPPVTDEKEIRSESISFKDVTFRSSPELRKKLVSTQFFKKEDTTIQRMYLPEERREYFLGYLQTHDLFTRKDYMKLYGCSKMTALNDLKKYIREGLIERTQYGNASVYRKKKDL